YGLSERDTFALGLFHTKTRWFDKRPRRADGETIEKAINFLERNRDSGGTELGVALEQALGLARSTDERARHTLIITDAEVSDAGRILRLAEEESRRDDRRRVSVLCIDAAPNSHLALQLAERGGGVAKFLTSDPDEEDISTALDEALIDWSEPALTGLRLEINSPVAQTAGREVRTARESGWSSVDLGDLPAGRAVWVIGRAPRGRLDDLSFKLTRHGLEPVPDIQIELHRTEKDHTAIKALFGARRVLGLEYLINSNYTGDELSEQLTRLGYDPGQALAPKSRVYAENARVEAVKALRSLLVREALDYGLACSATAFVAVRKEAGRVIEGRVAGANALPAGWSDCFAIAGGAPTVALFSPALPKRAASQPYDPSFYQASPGAEASSIDDPLLAAQSPALGSIASNVFAYFRAPDPQAEDERGAPALNRSVLFSGRPQGSGE